MATLIEITAQPSEAENLAAILNDYAAEGVNALGFHPLSTQRADPQLLARAITREQQLRLALTKAVLMRPEDLEGIDPALLDIVVYGFFLTSRNRATKARHLFTLTNTASGGPYTVKAGTLAQTQSGLFFEAIEEQNIPPGPSVTTIEFRAVTVGTTGNIVPGEIAKLMQGLPGVDISNAPGSLLIAAIDDETNVQLVARAQSRWGTLGRGGHDDAIRYLIATAVPSITRIGIDNANPFGPGTVGIWLANASGPATSQELLDAEAAVKRPLGSGVFSYLAALAVNVPVQAVLTTDGTNPLASVQTAANLQKLATNFPGGGVLGGTLARSLVDGILQGGAFAQYGIGPVAGIQSVNLVTPAANVVLTASEVLTITTNITQV